MSILRGNTGINILELEDGSLHELDHIIGQRVTVTSTDKQKHTGILQFVGTNQLFKKLGLHVTISRTPHIKIDSVSCINICK